MSNTGQLFSEKQAVRLYDAQDNEIGITIGGAKEIAYAMANSQRIVKAISYSALYGKETTLRADISSLLGKYKDKHKFGANLLFWVGEPIVINK